jgi:hypothetical protein
MLCKTHILLHFSSFGNCTFDIVSVQLEGDKGDGSASAQSQRAFSGQIRSCADTANNGY